MSRVLALSALAAVCAASFATAQPRFEERAAAAGLDHRYAGGDAFVVGGGAAAFDCDADGRLDLLLAGGEAPAQLFRNASAPGGAIAFAPGESPFPSAEAATRVTGAYPLDVDGDDRIDLFVMRFGRNLLLRGLGDCRFEDASDAWGLPEDADWTTAFAAHWERPDEPPTLAIGNYVDRDRPLQARENCQSSYLLRPRADGRGYAAPTPLTPSACPLSFLFVDWAGDGRFDLRAANDRQYYDRGLSEQLWRLTPAGARPLDDADGWRGANIWGMGLAAADLDGDRRPEIAVSNMADAYLEALVATAGGAPTYRNAAFDWGTMAQRPYTGGDVRPSTSWHVDFEDFDNDGRLDLWIVKGNVDAMPNFAAFDPDSLLMRSDGARFVEAGAEAGLALPTKGRGGVAADLNGDGALDLVTVNRNEAVTLFEGRSAPNAAWLAVGLRQDGANRRAVGGVIEVLTASGTQRRAVAVGGGHAGGDSAPTHFGLGDAPSAAVRAIWPDGAVSPWTPAPLNAAIALRRAADGGVAIDMRSDAP